MKFSDVTDLLGVTNSNAKKPIEPEHGGFNRNDLGPKETLLSWSAVPNISVSKLDPRYKRTFMIIAIVLGLLFVAMQEYFLIIAVASIAFLYQLLSKNDLSEEVNYEISTHGISIGESFYYWDEASRFFFSKSYGNTEFLVVDLKSGFPARLLITFLENDRSQLITVLNKYIRYLEVEPTTTLDRTYSAILDKFDFEQKK